MLLVIKLKPSIISGGDFACGRVIMNYGHKLVRRSQTMRDGALKSWVDSEITLGAGKLYNLSVYIHPNITREMPVRIQVEYPQNVLSVLTNSLQI